MTGIDVDDWENTPVPVRDLVEKLVEKIEQLEKHKKELQETNEKINEKVNQNSQNSNLPPALDPLDVQPPKKKRKPGTKKRGGQPGHKGHSRFLYPVEDCKQVTDYYPQRCSCCGEELTGSDSNPHRHQVVEIPPIKLEIVEHRLHQ